MQWKEKFLQALAQKANVAYACRIAGISRQTAYKAKQKAEDDPSDNFNELWDDAIEDGLDMMEEDLLKCARGELKGQIGGFIYMLKAKRYEKRSDNDAPKKLTLIWGGDGN